MQKITDAKVTSKKCNVCLRLDANEDIENIKPHKCPLNYDDGSSNAMESEAALDIVQNIYNENEGKKFVKAIVSDNDSTLRAILKHPSNHNKGRLPAHILEPRFLDDPGHRERNLSQPRSTPSSSLRNRNQPVVKDIVSSSK